MPIDNSLEFVPINIAIITISDTRTKENDTSGDTLERRITKAGHQMIKRIIIPDDINKIKAKYGIEDTKKLIDRLMKEQGISENTRWKPL